MRRSATPRAEYGDTEGVSRQSLSEVDYEVLDLLVQDEESVATILATVRNPNVAARFSPAARALDVGGLEAILRRLADLGLVEGHEELSDGYRMEPDATYTWWGLTTGGRRAWEVWDAEQSD